MELRHIRYFVTVAEEGSFTRAAESLMIAQPPLSRQIKDLEEELGTTLFDRSTRRLQLTEAGHRFYQYALKVLELVEQAGEDIREMGAGLSGTIALSSVEGAAPHLIAKWISKFHKQYPNVEYSLWNGSSDDVVDRVRKGLCEIGVITEPYNHEGFDGIDVFTEPWVAMIPPDNPLAGEPGDTVSFRQIAPYELIIPSRQSRKSEIEGWFAECGETPRIIGRLAHMVSAHELTRQNVGIAIYPAAAASIEAERVVSIKRLVEPEVNAVYVMVKSSSRPLSHAGQAFWDIVVEMTDAV